MQIRDAREEDFGAITNIYNEILLNTTAIYREDPISVDEALSMWRARLQLSYPTIVGGRDRQILGYASFGAFRAWPGYRYTVEHSVHVDEAQRGRGVGSALVRELLVRAADLGKHVMVGGIDAANTASLRFHERLGFKRVAYFEQVGFKFNRYLDLLFVQRFITEGGLVVSLASAGDAEAVSRCLAAAFEEFRSSYTPGAFADTVAAPAEIRKRMQQMSILIARDSKAEVAGTLAFSIDGASGHLRGMAVTPERRGSGIAQRLLAAAEAALIDAGCNRVTLDTTEPLQRAITFYERNGFTATRRVSDFFGMPLYEYAKGLSTGAQKNAPAG